MTITALDFWNDPDVLERAEADLERLAGEDVSLAFANLDAFGRGAVLYALDYGLAVFRLRPQDKRPLRAGWRAEATSDPVEVVRLFEQSPGANVGAAMGEPSGVDLIDADIDRKKEKNGPLALEVAGYYIPETWTAQTGRGGFHYYVKHRPGLKNQDGFLDGVDYKSTGGLVVLPPSIHPNGTPYTWLNTPGAVALAESPDWLPEAIPAREARPKEARATPTLDLPPTNGTAGDVDPYVSKAISDELSAVASAGEGTRNSTLNLAAFNLGQLCPRYASASDLLERLVAAAVSVGLSEGEARKTAGSGLSSGAKDPREIEPPHTKQERARKSIFSVALTQAEDASDGADVDAEEIAARAAEIEEALVSRPQTDPGAAERIVVQYQQDIRLVRSNIPGAATRPLLWSERLGRWSYDSGVALKIMALKTARRTHKLAAGRIDEAAEALKADPESAEAKNALAAAESLSKWARRSEGNARLEAAADCVYMSQKLEIDAEEIDARPMLMNVGNGTLDLETGKLRAPSRADLMTSGAPVKYDPAARAPTFERVVSEMFAGRDDVVAFVQEFVGLCLSGIVGGHAKAIPIFYGPSGNNGKSTLIDALFGVFGPYATETAAATFYAKPAHMQGGPSNDLAAIAGKRLTTAVETSSGARLDEATLKKISGGDMMVARFMHKEFFAFRPQAKIIFVTNHLPRVDACSPAMWTRLRLIPFEVEFGKPGAPPLDETIPAQLRAEAPGILNWALEGFGRFLADGFTPSPTVADATSEFRDSEDWLDEFLSTYAFEGENQRVDRADLWKAFRQAEDGRPRVSRPKFYEAVGGKYSLHKSDGKRYFLGLDLNTEGRNLISRSRLPDWGRN